MYLRGETHLRLCTLSSPPSEKTSGGRKKYLIPPVCGGSNRHRLTAPKGRIPPCVFYKRPEKSLARCPQVRRLPCGFFIILPLERFVKSILPFLPLHTRRDSACIPHPPIGRDSRTLQRIRTSQSNKNFPHVPATLKKRNKIPLRKRRGHGGSSR